MDAYGEAVERERKLRREERVMTRQSVLRKALAGEITWIQAAEILRLTARQVRRIRRRYQEGGEGALVDFRLGKKGTNRISNEWRKRICDLYRERYVDFSGLHFFEKLTKEHKIEVAGYESVLRILKEEGLIETGIRRSCHRKRRDRRPMTGMMLHLDGSTHAWLGEAHPNFDLLAVMDDATSEVYAACFVSQEGTRSCMGVLRETIEKMGIFCSLYVDRAMHFVITTKAGDKPDRTRKSQIERAFDRLGIDLICAYSPQARGRGERLWRTWQGRLPQELRVAGIQDMEAANRYLNKIFLPWHNRSLTKPAADPNSTAFVPLHTGVNLDLIFSVQCSRQVNADNTVQYKTKKLQILKDPKSGRYSYAGLTVTIHEHLDQTLSITYGPHQIGRYQFDGQLLMETQETPQKEAA